MNNAYGVDLVLRMIGNVTIVERTLMPARRYTRRPVQSRCRRRRLVTIATSIGAASAVAFVACNDVQATPVPKELLNRIEKPGNPPRSQAQKSNQIKEGRRLFFEETFDGNGRTCGTCHPAENNFTLDPDFIRGLPDSDPLFVHERVPALRELEDAGALRRRGLICENLDGFDRPCVLRGIPHNIAMPTSLKSNLPGKAHALGWSGDGSPGEGTLRLFSVGAVMQHFPKTLDRIEGVDFRLPTGKELDAMDAFMRSLGRQGEVNIANLDLSGPAAAGRHLFNGLDEDGDENANRRACSACHHNAGASTPDGINRNFDTGTRNLPHPGPPDGGFGENQQGNIAGFGDGTMNTPPLFEAADTPPFFHNNAMDDLEGAVAFYTTATFRDSPAGRFGGGAFALTPAEVNLVAAFLRVINALENATGASDLLRQAQRERGGVQMARIREAVHESEDAIEVLEGSPLGNLSPGGVTLLEDSIGFQEHALTSGLRQNQINADIRAARAALADARKAILEGS